MRIVLSIAALVAFMVTASAQSTTLTNSKDQPAKDQPAGAVTEPAVANDKVGEAPAPAKAGCCAGKTADAKACAGKAGATGDAKAGCCAGKAAGAGDAKAGACSGHDHKAHAEAHGEHGAHGQAAAPACAAGAKAGCCAGKAGAKAEAKPAEK